MGCLLGLFARVGLLVVWLQTALVKTAFHDGWILPLLGIIFFPVTTLTAWLQQVDYRPPMWTGLALSRTL